MTTTKQIARIGPFKDLIASAVRAGDLLTLSGQVSVNKEGEVIGVGDIGAQLKQAYTNVMEVLAEFDAPPGSIVDETWFVTNIEDVMANVEQLISIREEMLGSSTRDVAHTLVEVSRLVELELLIEVKCIARL